MRKIIRIARLELSMLFYSPIAWLLLIIFLIQCGISYTEMLYNQETSQQLGRPLSILTRVLFAGDHGLLSSVAENLYLYIPLLTMGLFSRELSSGSIKLLQSSPVTNIQIVLGKFGAMVAYSVLLCAVIALYLIAAGFSVANLDIGFVLGGIFGLFLLMMAYSAIGLFMSSLTAYQIVAAISTLAVLAAFNFIGGLWQHLDGWRDLTYWLALSGKVETIINGLITSRDIVYFLAFTAFFLCLTVLKLNAGRKKRSLGLKLATYSGLMLLLVSIVYVTALPRLIWYGDTTRVKDQTISPKGQQVLAQLDKPIKMTSYVNLLHYQVSYGEPANRIRDRKAFERYQRFLPHLEMDYVSYYDTIPGGLRDTTKTIEEQARHIAKVKKFDFDQVLDPDAIRSRIDLRPENNAFVRILEYDGKTAPLRMFDDLIQYPSEPEVMAAVKRLIQTPAKVWLLTGHGERSLVNMDNSSYRVATKGQHIRASLLNQGFDPIEVEIGDLHTLQKDSGVLIISDPMTAYSQTDQTSIVDYIESGGNMILVGEPGKQDLLDPILRYLGLHFDAGTILQESEKGEMDVVEASFTPEAAKFGFSFFDGAKVSMPGSMSISILDSSRFSITPVLVSNPELSWRKMGSFNLADEIVAFEPDKDQRGSYLLLAALTRPVQGRAEQKIIVAADADFMSNYELTSRFGVQNVNFVLGKMFSWFTHGEYPFNPDRARGTDNRIVIERSGITKQKILFFGILPLVLLGLGTRILYRRRRN